MPFSRSENTWFKHTAKERHLYLAKGCNYGNMNLDIFYKGYGGLQIRPNRVVCCCWPDPETRERLMLYLWTNYMLVQRQRLGQVSYRVVVLTSCYTFIYSRVNACTVMPRYFSISLKFPKARSKNQAKNVYHSIVYYNLFLCFNFYPNNRTYFL